MEPKLILMKTETKALLFILICTVGGIFLFYQGMKESSQTLIVCGAILLGLSVAGWVKLYNPN